MIRADGIDILVDLTLHMARNRLLIFARKPAPVQVSYLGYCGTTGLWAMDYRLSDWHMDPEGTDLSCYREETVRLARSYWCYRPGGVTPEIGPLLALAKGHVTFGCLNNFAKVSAGALELWAKILRELPESRLLLQAPEGTSRRRVLEVLEREGVSRERIEFVGRQSWEGYVASLGQVDVALDPFPYGGGITTCDALWMGAPVVSLCGQTSVGRGGCSILKNLALSELLAETPRQYVEIAVCLARDLSRLGDLRSTLRQRMEASPLREARGFARDTEAAYREMWRSWCSKGGLK
jgi:predicted O-linked N-acetylglucosamine transferase (SPINDLY family)